MRRTQAPSVPVDHRQEPQRTTAQQLAQCDSNSLLGERVPVVVSGARVDLEMLHSVLSAPRLTTSYTAYPRALYRKCGRDPLERTTCAVDCPSTVSEPLRRALGPALWGPGDLAHTTGPLAESIMPVPDALEGPWLLSGGAKPLAWVGPVPDGVPLVLPFALPPLFAAECTFLVFGELDWLCVPVPQNSSSNDGSNNDDSSNDRGREETSTEFVKRLQKLSKDMRGMVTAEALDKAGVEHVFFTQRAGELVVLPPLCFRQATLRQSRDNWLDKAWFVSWLRHNLQTLHSAMVDGTALWRSESRMPPYDAKALLYQAASTVCSHTTTTSSAASAPLSQLTHAHLCFHQQQRAASPTALLSDYRVLLRALSTIEHDEWLNQDAIEWAYDEETSKSPLEPREGETVAHAKARLYLPHDLTARGDEPFKLLCTACHTPIFGRYFDCLDCSAHYCLECVRDGRRCLHLKDFVLKRLRRLGDVQKRLAQIKRLYDDACGLGSADMVCHDATATLGPPLATAAFQLVQYARQGAVGECHWCKRQLPRHRLVGCRAEDDNDRTQQCRQLFCRRCLEQVYHTAWLRCVAGPRWACPCCDGSCVCDECVKQRELEQRNVTPVPEESPAATMESPLPPPPPRPPSPPSQPATVETVEATEVSTVTTEEAEDSQDAEDEEEAETADTTTEAVEKEGDVGIVRMESMPTEYTPETTTPPFAESSASKITTPVTPVTPLNPSGPCTPQTPPASAPAAPTTASPTTASAEPDYNIQETAYRKRQREESDEQ